MGISRKEQKAAQKMKTREKKNQGKLEKAWKLRAVQGGGRHFAIGSLGGGTLTKS